MYRLNKKNTVCAILGIVALFLAFGIGGKYFRADTYGGYKETLSRQEPQKEEEAAAPAEETGKCAYLTFDDGPSEITEQILAVLSEKQVKATFFLIGSQINEKTLPLIKKMVEQGHQIGLHTYSHSQQIYGSYADWAADMEQGRAGIMEGLKSLGFGEVRLQAFRFPWGSTNGWLASFKKQAVEQLHAAGMEYYDWNVSAEDSIGRPTRYSILQNVTKDYGKFDHPVILMHDSQTSQKTADVLPEIIDRLKKDGYAFGTVSEMEEAFHY